MLKVTGVGQGHPEEDLQEGRGKDIDQDLYHPGQGTCSIFVILGVVYFLHYTYIDSHLQFQIPNKKMHLHSVSGFP